jgi:hypothetical protein
MLDLAAKLHERCSMQAIRARVWAQRDAFTFDAHADRLLAFFRTVIENRKRN